LFDPAGRIKLAAMLGTKYDKAKASGEPKSYNDLTDIFNQHFRDDAMPAKRSANDAFQLDEQEESAVGTKKKAPKTREALAAAAAAKKAAPSSTTPKVQAKKAPAPKKRHCKSKAKGNGNSSQGPNDQDPPAAGASTGVAQI
jgi:hypothetical protein